MAQRLFPTHGEVSTDEIYADLVLPHGPPDRPYVVANMVTTVDGVVAVHGRAAGIGSRVDSRLMRQIRAAADGLLVGAGTLRAEVVDPTVPAPLAAKRRARGAADQPLAIAISRHLDLEPGSRFLRGGPDQTVILTTTSAAADREAALAGCATIVRIGADELDIATALATLRTRFGVQHLVVEGGPTLNRSLLDARLIDELFVTIAPKLTGGAGPTLIGGGPGAGSFAAHLSLVSLYEHEAELFARYRVHYASARPE